MSAFHDLSWCNLNTALMQDVFSCVGYQCVSQVGIMSAERSVEVLEDKIQHLFDSHIKGFLNTGGKYTVKQYQLLLCLQQKKSCSDSGRK